MAKTDNPYALGPGSGTEFEAWNEGYAAARADMTPVVEALREIVKRGYHSGLPEKLPVNFDVVAWLSARKALASIQESE